MKTYELRETIGIDGIVLNKDRPMPEPGPHDILVKVHAASLNNRDLSATKGVFGYTKFPVIPLSDGAGEVVDTGPSVTLFRKGDRVAGTFFQTWQAGIMPHDASRNSLGGMRDGMLTQFALLPETGTIHVPDNLTFEEASTLPCAALTAWNALIEQGQLKAGETVLVLGTGGVSCFAIQFARMHGARVILTSGSDAKLERGKALGADHLINYAHTPDWDKAVLDMTGGIGVDHVVEVGGTGTLERSMNSTRPAGSIYVIGALAQPGEFNMRIVNRKALRLQGIHVGSREMFAAMNKAVARAGLRPAIDTVFAYEDAPAALRHMQERGHFGKIVISVN